jgi:hypothetical protein
MQLSCPKGGAVDTATSVFDMRSIEVAVVLVVLLSIIVVVVVGVGVAVGYCGVNDAPSYSGSSRATLLALGGGGLEVRRYLAPQVPVHCHSLIQALSHSGFLGYRSV